MPLAPVDESGTQYYYVDTGAPSNSPNYTTLVLIHGASFQSCKSPPMSLAKYPFIDATDTCSFVAIFERLFPFSAEHNMRLVAVNMRDYRGSTPYSPEDLADLWSTDAEKQAKTLRGRGLEMATFLLWFIRKENIPPLLQEKMRGSFSGGGISVLGWSWGCKIALSCFARAHDLEPDDRHLLGNHLRGLILFGEHHLTVPRSFFYSNCVLLDPSPRVFGARKETPQELYNPFSDTSMSPEQLMNFFPGWVSSYYAHSPQALGTLCDQSRADVCAGFARSPIANPPLQLTPTLTRMSEGEAARTVNSDVILRSHKPQEFFEDKVYADSMRRALCDTSVWPNLRVVLLWCDMSVSGIVLSTWGIMKEYHETWPNNGRRIDFVRMKGANHFVRPLSTEPQYVY